MIRRLIIPIFLFVSILIGVFGISSSAKAQTLYQTVYRQPDFSASTGSSNIGTSNNIWYQSLGNGLEGTFTRVLLKALASSSSISLYIIRCDNLDLSPNWFECDGRTDLLSNQSATLTNGYFTWEFSELSFSDPTKYYVLMFLDTDGNTINFQGSTDADSYDNGICRRTVTGAMTTCPNSIADLYFFISQPGYEFTDILIATTTTSMFAQLTELASTTFPISDCTADDVWSIVNLSTTFCHAKNFLMDLARVLIIPGEGSLEFFLDSLNSFKTTFPFNIVFNTVELINEQLSVEISDSRIILPELEFNGGQTLIPEITLVSTTSLRNINPTVYDQLRTLEEQAIWLGLLIAIVLTII